MKLTRLFEQEYVAKPKCQNVGLSLNDINELMEVMDYPKNMDTYESSSKRASTGPTHSTIAMPKPVQEPCNESTLAAGECSNYRTTAVYLSHKYCYLTSY